MDVGNRFYACEIMKVFGRMWQGKLFRSEFWVEGCDTEGEEENYISCVDLLNIHDVQFEN
jgi:hypothetical protein